MTTFFTVGQIAAAGAQRKPSFNVPWRPALQQWSPLYTAAAHHAAHVEPCMLAAIVARESAGRNVIQYGHDPVTMRMPDGSRPGVGLCQITAGVDWSDLKSPTFAGLPMLDPTSNLLVAARDFLEPLLVEFSGSHVAAFAAYNLGAGGVERELRAGQDPDTYTTGHDYGHAVFTDWINFTAVALGVDVAWSTYHP